MTNELFDQAESLKAAISFLEIDIKEAKKMQLEDETHITIKNGRCCSNKTIELKDGFLSHKTILQLYINGQQKRLNQFKKQFKELK